MAVQSASMLRPAAESAELAAHLLQVLRPEFPGALRVEGLQRLSGGASLETWTFHLITEDSSLPLVLRRSPGGSRGTPLGTSLPLDVESKLIRVAATHAVPAPRIRCDLPRDAEIGSGFIMDFIAGETIPRKILRDARFAKARARLTRECGEVLARIHAIEPAEVPDLPVHAARDQVAQYRAIYDAFDDPRPVFELAFRWLDDHAPADTLARVVHGDFRSGNLMVDEEGLRAVLDWELAHVGDAHSDLGWICVNSWRFGEVDKPVGGFGMREDLIAAYSDAGGDRIDSGRVHYWEVFGTLKWGVICMMMYGAYRSGLDPSVERAAIGRRASETEIDLLALLAPRKAG